MAAREFLPPQSNEGGTTDTNDTKQDRSVDDGGTVDTSDIKTGKGLDDDK